VQHLRVRRGAVTAPIDPQDPTVPLAPGTARNAGHAAHATLVALVVLTVLAAPAVPARAQVASGLQCPSVPDAQQLAAGVAPVHAFAGSDGADPWGSLNILGSTLYGRTMVGGAQDQGVIFQVGTDGSGYQLPVSFLPGKDNGQGKQPHHDNMFWDGTKFWGTVLEGGSENQGVIYTFDPANATYTPMHVYAGGTGDGSQSHSGLIQGEGALYAMSAKGGANDRGTLLRVDATTGATQVLYSFVKATGDDPHGRLVLGSDGHTLFGMTRAGGKDDTGVVFSFDPRSSTYTVLKHFGKESDTTNGAIPDHGFLTLVGSTLWGLTTYGGPHDKGVLFSIGEDGSGFTIVHGFGGDGDGEKPHGSLIRQGDFLYGTGYSGGAFGVGTVFRIGVDGTGYTTFASFGGSLTGAYPKDNVTFSGDATAMYGMTIAGGVNDPDCARSYGTVFRVATPSAPGEEPASTTTTSTTTLPSLPAAATPAVAAATTPSFAG